MNSLGMRLETILKRIAEIGKTSTIHGQATAFDCIWKNKSDSEIRELIEMLESIIKEHDADSEK